MCSGRVRILMGLFVVLGMSSPVVWASDELTQVVDAEPAQGQAGMALIGQLKSVCQELSLSGDVRTKVDAILAKATEDAEMARKDAKDERGAYGKISDVMRGATVEIMRLLDDDQKLMFQSKMRAAAAVDATGAPAAGDGGAAEVRAVPIGQRIKNAVAPLKLSDEQNKKIDGVITDLEGKIAELRKGGTGVTELREKMQAMRQDLIKQMGEIFTEEQFAKFQENIKKQPQNAQGGIAGAVERLAANLQRLQDGTKQVGLSDEQKAKLDGAFDSAKEKFKELGPKLQGGPTPELRAELGAVYQELRTQMQTILTPEQQEKFKAHMRETSPAGQGAVAAEKGAEKKH